VVSKHLNYRLAKKKLNPSKYSGAFAFFGPGDFGDMYTALSRPAADNKLHFAGEALSIRHA
jgi:hypothetical protein